MGMNEPTAVFGMTIRLDETGALPQIPSIEEQAKRIVRRGLADIRMRGKSIVEAGPEPMAPTHAVVYTNTRGRADEVIVSRDVLYELQMSMLQGGLRNGGDRAFEALWRGKYDAEYEHPFGGYVLVGAEIREGESQDRVMVWARRLLEEAIEKREQAERLKRVRAMFDAAEMPKLEPWQERWVDAAVRQWRASERIAFPLTMPRYVGKHRPPSLGFNFTRRPRPNGDNHG